jgi:hypothetical protein
MNLEYAPRGRSVPRTGDHREQATSCETLIYAPMGAVSHIEVYTFKAHYEVWEYHYDDNDELVSHCVMSSLAPPDRHFDE